ncbi:hypothetical protein ACFL96_01085 [Thermoproteota archaeon]
MPITSIDILPQAVQTEIKTSIFELERAISRFIPAGNKAMFITNLPRGKGTKEDFYCLIIKKDWISYSYQSKKNISVIQFDSRKKELLKDAKPLGLDKISQLTKNVKHVLEDYAKKRAYMYVK